MTFARRAFVRVTFAHRAPFEEPPRVEVTTALVVVRRVRCALRCARAALAVEDDEASMVCLVRACVGRDDARRRVRARGEGNLFPRGDVVKKSASPDSTTASELIINTRAAFFFFWTGANGW